jgi:hypothetical protein
MAETQRDGMQMKALQSKSINGLIAINRIAKDRVSDLREMASQLMGAAGDGP